MTKKLPTPRLQLRWAESEHNGYQWQCHYELVMPLGKWDVRAEVYKNGKELKKKLTELVVQMKTPSLRQTSSRFPPCTYETGRFCDTPFRDGAHIQWDAKELGNLPMYCIAPDGMAFVIEEPKQ